MTCCRAISEPGVLPGWGCCGCQTYNAENRPRCRACGHARCFAGGIPEMIGDLHVLTDQEVEHGVDLLREVATGWAGPRAIIEIDPVCRFNDGRGPCGQPLGHAVILQGRDPGDDQVSVLAVCPRHAACMDAAIKRWRSRA